MGGEGVDDSETPTPYSSRLAMYFTLDNDSPASAPLPS